MLIALGAATLFGCGSESTADLYLMDAPPPGVTSVRLHIAAMQAHVVGIEESDETAAGEDDDDKWVSLSVDRSIDLVQHQGETAADLLGQLDLPAGKITQLRLVVDTTKPNVATFNGADCNLDTSRVEKKGIKINHVFKAFELKKNNTIYVDFELDRSMSAKDGCFELDPKLRLHKVKVDGLEALLD